MGRQTNTIASKANDGEIAACAGERAKEPEPDHYVTDKQGQKLACYPREGAAHEFDCLPVDHYAYRHYYRGDLRYEHREPTGARFVVELPSV